LPIDAALRRMQAACGHEAQRVLGTRE
jgi:hypothetical protein